jgi:ABC-type transport system involved in multi-copper enzyme maturation permease subunit
MTVPATVPLVSTKSSPRAPGRVRPVGTVFGWELRRLAATRSTWIILAIAFAVSCLAEVLFRAATQYPLMYPGGATRTFWIDWGSNYGLFNTLPQAPGMYLGLYLPFVATDGVARDLKRRTHELVMTTAIPSWAYVWGRYLSALLLSVALAVVMLLAIVAVAAVRYQAQPDIFLTPDLPGIVALWAAFVLPPTVLLCSVSFVLGTLLPRRSTLIKLTVMLSWFIIGNLAAHTAARCQDCAVATGDAVWRAAWDPTGLALSFLQTPDSLLKQLAAHTQSLSDAAFLEYLHALERQLPDMSAWIAPHMIWVLIGVALVALSTPFFQRFRKTIG